MCGKVAGLAGSREREVGEGRRGKRGEKGQKREGDRQQ